MECVQQKRRATASQKRAKDEKERQKKRASGEIGPDDNSDAPPVKRGRPMKDDALVRRLAKQAGVRPEIILLTDRNEYVEEEEEDDNDDDDY
jgi:hypothetical protein